MEYKEQVRDYLKRCQTNLEIIQNNEGYEFTQLFSNFISALIFIKENRTFEEDAMSKYRLTCKVISNSYHIDFSIDIREFIRHLRNACCHYGIQIESNNHEIDKVIFKDKGKEKSIKTGKTEPVSCKFELTKDEIERVYNYLMKLI